jgi:branched-chain amino acid transport system permease protein
VFRAVGTWRLIIYGVLLIVVIIFAPKGLAGLRKYFW